jgi:hypothetical protein
MKTSLRSWQDIAKQIFLLAQGFSLKQQIRLARSCQLAELSKMYLIDFFERKLWHEKCLVKLWKGVQPPFP